MSRTETTFFKPRCVDALTGHWQCIRETRSFGSIGPDPGRVVETTVLVDDVSREYASMLAREFTKADQYHAWSDRDDGIFDIVPAVSRLVDMFADPENDAISSLPAAVY